MAARAPRGVARVAQQDGPVYDDHLGAAAHAVEMAAEVSNSDLDGGCGCVHVRHAAASFAAGRREGAPRRHRCDTRWPVNQLDARPPGQGQPAVRPSR